MSRKGKINRQRQILTSTLVKIIVAGTIMMGIFFVLSLCLPIRVSFCFHVLLFSTLDLILISIPIVFVIEMFITKEKLRFDVIKYLLLLTFLFGGFVWATFKFYLIEKIIDIPYVITSNYSVVEGICSDAHTGGKNAFYFKINDIYFRTNRSAKQYVYNGNRYRVFYLPKSKTIMDIDKLEELSKVYPLSRTFWVFDIPIT